MQTNDPRARAIDIEMFGAHVGQEFVRQLRQFTRTCIICQHWNGKAEECAKFNARPPATVIAYGCPDFVETPPF